MFGNNPYRKLEKKIGYRFKDKAILVSAVTHRSYRFENEGIDSDNQRLEFLGDAVLGFMTGSHLFNLFTNKREGYLTSLRSQLVNGKTLAIIAERIDLGSFLKMGHGEEKAGGRDRPTILADALEAIIGAAFVDGGIKAAGKIFSALFITEVDDLTGDIWAGNPKGELQKVTQRAWQMAPNYKVISQDGPAHNTFFTVEVWAGNECIGTGEGPNKRDAEGDAATKALDKLKEI